MSFAAVRSAGERSHRDRPDRELKGPCPWADIGATRYDDHSLTNRRLPHPADLWACGRGSFTTSRSPTRHRRRTSLALGCPNSKPIIAFKLAWHRAYCTWQTCHWLLYSASPLWVLPQAQQNRPPRPVAADHPAYLLCYPPKCPADSSTRIAARFNIPR